MCSSITSAAILKGSTKPRLREELHPSNGLCVVLLEAGCMRPGLGLAVAVPERGSKERVQRATRPF